MKALLGAILVLATVLRLHALTTSPPPSHNRDELEWAWAGQSLIVDHSPSSWSYLSAYRNPDDQRTFDGETLPYVHPWLDAPPLFALLVGDVAVAAGERTPESVRPQVIRWVPLVLSLVSLVLLNLLATRLIGRRWALLAALLYAVSPWNLQMAHAVEAESLLAPMLLGALLLVERRGRGAVAGLLAICVLAPMVKLVGMAIGAAMVPLLLVQRRRLDAAAAGAAALGGVGLYVLYGMAVDHRTFVAVIHADAARHGALIVSAWQFLASLKAGLGGFVPLHDPFWFAGLLAVAGTALYWRDRRFLTLIVPIAVYTAAMAFMAPSRRYELTYNAGWYRMTIYPLLFIAIAAVIARLVALPARSSPGGPDGS